MASVVLVSCDSETLRLLRRLARKSEILAGVVALSSSKTRRPSTSDECEIDQLAFDASIRFTTMSNRDSVDERKDEE